MSKKPTYEELLQKGNALEKEINKSKLLPVLASAFFRLVKKLPKYC